MSLIYVIRKLRNCPLDRWLIPYLLQFGRRLRRPRGPIHVLICIADHFEPKIKTVSDDVALARVEKWVSGYPESFGSFRDSDGRSPRHTFFYPIEEYDPALLDALAGLCRAGYGEVELHLHHDHDTAENLRKTLLEARDGFRSRHGLLARDRRTGQTVFGFIHGNWSLDNSRGDGRWCGVNNELDVLREAGCYADFTFPSAPDPTQPWTINSIYYAIDDPERPRSHDRGIDAGTSPAPANGLMLIQGPLVLDWGRRRFGVFPRIENGCIQHSQPPHIDRLALWIKARVQVRNRPDWYFVKLYAHGGYEHSYEVLLGEPMVQFHRNLADRARRDANFHYHYVTAREMYNLVKAAEEGWSGTVAAALDHHLIWDKSPESPDLPTRSPSLSSTPKDTMMTYSNNGAAGLSRSAEPAPGGAFASEKTEPRGRAVEKVTRFLLAANTAFLIRLIRFGARDSLERLRESYYQLEPFEPKPSRDVVSQLAAIKEIDLSDLIGSTSITLDANYRYEAGTLPFNQLLVVLALLRHRQPQIVVEIGTYWGTTTKEMSLNLPGSTIHTVDLPLDYTPGSDPKSAMPKDDLHLIRKRRVGDAFRDDPRCSNIIQHFADTADWDFQAAKGATFFLIDGSHTYEYCKNDTLKALAVAGPGSLIIWHDCDRAHPGVVACLNELIASGRTVRRIQGTTLATLEAGAVE